MPAMKELTIKEEKFCEAYIRLDGHADKAFQEAFGYSQATTGYGNANQLMKKPEIFFRIQE
ncbi:MAG: terminase small subunit [Rhodomicrobium sp.]